MLAHGGVAISRTEVRSSGFTWPSCSGGTDLEDRLDLAREVERVRIEEHQLLLDPHRERMAQ